MARDCLIQVNSQGKYCCLAAPRTDGELQYITLSEGALIFKSANLPETVLECLVKDEWVDSGITVGGDEPCTVVCKPACYRLAIDCADYEGIEAPEEGAVELCYDLDRDFDKAAYFMEQLAENSGDTDANILACLQELKLLVAANNDAVAIATIINDLQTLIEGQGDVLTELQALCDKLLLNNEDNTASLEVLTALCEKLEKLIENSDLSDYKVIKENGVPGANYNGAFRYIFGRPPASSAWALIDNRDPLNQVTVASGPNLNAFTADLESKGFTEWPTLEEHWVCPCPEGLTEADDGAYFVTVDGETSAKLVCTPIEEVPDVPEAKIIDNTAVCALRTVGCNDDRRDNLLQAILEALTADFVCEETPEVIEAKEQTANIQAVTQTLQASAEQIKTRYRK